MTEERIPFHFTYPESALCAFPVCGLLGQRHHRTSRSTGVHLAVSQVPQNLVKHKPLEHQSLEDPAGSSTAEELVTPIVETTCLHLPFHLVHPHRFGKGRAVGHMHAPPHSQLGYRTFLQVAVRHPAWNTAGINAYFDTDARPHTIRHVPAPHQAPDRSLLSVPAIQEKKE